MAYICNPAGIAKTWQAVLQAITILAAEGYTSEISGAEMELALPARTKWNLTKGDVDEESIPSCNAGLRAVCSPDTRARKS